MIDGQKIAALPASQIVQQVNQALHTQNRLVITAPPGAGKSTLLPLTILEGGLPTDGRILMLEPRRLAARQIAERMAELLGEEVGQTVGYRIRFEKKVSAQTRIEVLTEGILTRMLISDPMLEGVQAVIFDEFHERSLASDLALALVLESQQLVRDDLRVVLMSATIDATSICQSLKAPLIHSEGRMFPVEIIYSPDEATPQNAAGQVARCIISAHSQHEGDILAFLPGQADILRCRDLLSNSLAPTRVIPLYGLLSPAEQRMAILPSRPGERKVVLATSIAETSITIQGVRIVVDSGLCRTMIYDPVSELSHLETVRISLDMAEQRMGRAGRVAEGICYRLWNKAIEHRMEPFRRPEILDADLASTTLSISAWGESNPMELPWLTPPPKGNLARSTSLLQSLRAVDDAGKITPIGQEMVKLPCHPRIARMLLSCHTNEERALAADIAALLEEKDPLAEQEVQSDINTRIILLRQARQRNQPGKWSRILRIADEYRNMVRAHEDNHIPDANQTGFLLTTAYPERLATTHGGFGQFRLANGTLAQLDKADALVGQQWLVVATLNASSGRIYLASTVHVEDLLPLCSTRQNLSWNSKRGQLIAQREERIGNLVLRSQPLQKPDREAVIQIICQACQHEGQSMLNFSDAVAQLQQRVATVAEWHPELQLPDLCTQSVLRKTAEWLPFYLENEGHLRTSVTELKHIDLCTALWGLLTYEQQLAVDRLAPTHITVPTGSHIRVDYRPGAEAPVVSVRLQECFGLTDTPRVNDGKQPVLMELLSPGFKPVQLTQDLASFWQNTYFEVRKELRRRYPKHYWPDNPLEAEATRGVRHK